MKIQQQTIQEFYGTPNFPEYYELGRRKLLERLKKSLNQPKVKIEPDQAYLVKKEKEFNERLRENVCFDCGRKLPKSQYGETNSCSICEMIANE